MIKPMNLLLLNSNRDIIDWIGIVLAFLTAIVPAIIFIFKKISNKNEKEYFEIEYEGYGFSTHLGNNISIIIKNFSTNQKLLIDSIKLVLDDCFIITLSNQQLRMETKSGKVDAIYIEPGEVYRHIFHFTNATIDGKSTQVDKLIHSSYRRSFFATDKFGKIYKLPFKYVDNHMKPAKKSKLKNEDLMKRDNKREFKYLNTSSRYVLNEHDKNEKVVVSEDVIYEITLTNKINGNQKHIYINESGSLNEILYDIVKIPQEDLTDNEALYRYLILKHNKYGSNMDILSILPLGRPNKRDPFNFIPAEDLRRMYLGNKVSNHEKYPWILINLDNGKYHGYHRAKERPKSGSPHKLSWIEWNKPLPNNLRYFNNGDPFYYIDGDLVEIPKN